MWKCKIYFIVTPIWLEVLLREFCETEEQFKRSALSRAFPVRLGLLFCPEVKISPQGTAHVFFKDCSVFGSIHLPLNTTQFVCWNGKHCLNAMQPPPCFTVGAMFLGCWVMKGLFQDQHLIYLFILSRQTAESSLARVSRASTLSRITVISSADSWRLSDSNEVHFSSGL